MRTVFRYRLSGTDNIPARPLKPRTDGKGSPYLSGAAWVEQQGLGESAYISAIEVVEQNERQPFDAERDGGKWFNPRTEVWEDATPPFKLVAYIERYALTDPDLDPEGKARVMADGNGHAARYWRHYEVTSIELLLDQFESVDEGAKASV